MDSLLRKIRTCEICNGVLPFRPKPILSFSNSARILIVGQAPGRKAHESGQPWNDASGVRLRSWLGTTDQQFYDESLIAIVPMGFCYPGKGQAGDLPPRPECSSKWMASILNHLDKIELKIFVGAYAQGYFLKTKSGDLTSTVKNWRAFAPDRFPLPHPSPRNNIWLAKNPWFEKILVPELQAAVRATLLWSSREVGEKLNRIQD